MKATILFALGVLAAGAKKHHAKHHHAKHHHAKVHHDKQLQKEIAGLRQSFLNLDAMGPAPYGLPMDKDGKTIPGSPAYPTPQPFVRGEKQWMDNSQNIGDWGDQQMTVANERIPYWSTVQLKDSAETDYEKDTDMSVLYEEDHAPSFPEKVVTLAEQVPLSLRLVQLKQDDDPDKMEGFAMADLEVPQNFRLIHIATDDGELMRFEK